MQVRSGVKCFLFALVLVSLGFIMPSLLLSATYYVDPLAGNDTRNGVSRASAWKTIPGTYKLDNSGFLFVPGAPTGWAKINAGDVIKIRSGTTILNKLVIDATWYNNGTSSTPILITRDDTWGTGSVTFEGSQQSLEFWDTMVLVWSRDYVQIDGVSTDGIVIQNANGAGFQGTGTSESVKMKGLTVKNVKFFNNEKFNVILQRCDSFHFENIDIDGNRRDTNASGGFMIGGGSYGCSNGRLVNCRSYNHGDTPGSQGGGTEARIGFWLTNSVNITYENCVAHDNEGHGFDAGVVGNPPSVRADNIKYVNCEAYNNSVGFSSNLDDIPGAARFWYINSISARNYAGWMVYNGASSHIYNCLTTGNRWGIYIDSLAYVNRITFIEMKNTIFYKNSRGWPDVNTWDLWHHRVDGLDGDSDYNHFEQGIQDTSSPGMERWNGTSIITIPLTLRGQPPGGGIKT